MRVTWVGSNAFLREKEIVDFDFKKIFLKDFQFFF